jgi:internalin A
VAVISKKYLRSFYCMYEIHKLRERCQGDADELARRVVPIVLPEVKVGNALKRAPYVRYWKAEEKKLEKLHREMGLSLSPESMQEAKLVREFANCVDDILIFLNDILMPRQLEAHLDHGFAAVREALQRRMSGK